MIWFFTHLEWSCLLCFTCGINNCTIFFHFNSHDIHLNSLTGFSPYHLSDFTLSIFQVLSDLKWLADELSCGERHTFLCYFCHWNNLLGIRRTFFSNWLLLSSLIFQTRNLLGRMVCLIAVCGLMTELCWVSSSTTSSYTESSTCCLLVHRVMKSLIVSSELCVLAEQCEMQISQDMWYKLPCSLI